MVVQEDVQDGSEPPCGGHERRRLHRASESELADWDEATLVSRAQVGDATAFGLLVGRYQAPLFRHAVRLLRDRAGAEDVVQESLVTAWRNLPGLARVGAFRGWLYQIVTRRTLNALRSRRPVQEFDEHQPPGDLRGGSRVGEDPAVLTERAAQLAALDAAVGQLSEDQRLAWLLREVDGLSYEEIAMATSQPLSTVRGRIARARREVAERMSSWR